MTKRMSDLTASPGVRWVLGLSEPLLPLNTRIRAERELETACIERPDWAVVYFGGIIADMILTLPSRDVWRNLSARVGNMTRGDRPPTSTGAVTPEGAPFGTWVDSSDVVDVVFDTNPELDVTVNALVEPLSGRSAAMIAFAADGWRPSIDAARAVYDEAASWPSSSPEAAARQAGIELHLAGTAAVRWAVHRRRSYGVLEDPWPVESGWAWSWRAEREVSGHVWPEHEVAFELSFERISEAGVYLGEVVFGEFQKRTVDPSTAGLMDDDPDHF